ncbi:MAG: hypothetical protein M3209_18515 [Acidobacteriota bacterium]|nr:hypothetical protein [Acidobacteriota bacterium]
MLKKSCLLLPIFLLLFGAAFGQKTKPQPTDKKPRNVIDFLLLLPKNYVGNYTAANRQKYLKENGTTDTANGYLQFFGNGEIDPFVVVAIFKKDDGNYLITTSVSGSDRQKYYFLDYDGKKFVDAAKRVLPADFGTNKFQEGYTCELPRFNRTINCRDNDGKLTYLGWTGKEFVIE